MAALAAVVLRNDPKEIVIKYAGQGSVNTTLASMVAPGQTVNGTPKVAIMSVFTSLAIQASTLATITRNATAVMTLFQTTSWDVNEMGGPGSMLTENATSDVTVNIAGSIDGVVIVRYRKLEGYSYTYA